MAGIGREGAGKIGPWRVLGRAVGLALVAGALVAGALAAPVAAQDHPLPSEGTLEPTGAEFIEGANPTDTTWHLSAVYLSDDADYALPAGTASSAGGPLPSIGIYDFIARFPAGTVLAPGGVLVVDPDGVGFGLAWFAALLAACLALASRRRARTETQARARHRA